MAEVSRERVIGVDAEAENGHNDFCTFGFAGGDPFLSAVIGNRQKYNSADQITKDNHASQEKGDPESLKGLRKSQRSNRHQWGRHLIKFRDPVHHVP